MEEQKRIKQFKGRNPEFETLSDLEVRHIIEMYELNIRQPFEPSSIPFSLTGSFILWSCWLFFNAGTARKIQNSSEADLPAKIMANTILSGATGGIASLLLKPFLQHKQSVYNRYDPGALSNGILSGLVAITAPCNNVEPWASIIIGLLAAIVYNLACRLFLKLEIDDPLEASQVHGFCGFLGTICVGLFDNEKGLFKGGKFTQLGIQLVGALTILIWCASISFAYFKILDKLKRFRVGKIYEITGMDALLHGGTRFISEKRLNEIEKKQRAEREDS